MRRFLLAACLVGLVLAGSSPAWPQDSTMQGALPSTLPLRRDAPGVAAAPTWLAATGALVMLGLGATVLVGRRRQWAWLQARRVRRDSRRELVRISSQALTAHASLHTVRWNGEELLLACTPQQVTLLARRPVAPPSEGEVA